MNIEARLYDDESGRLIEKRAVPSPPPPVIEIAVFPEIEAVFKDEHVSPSDTSKVERVCYHLASEVWAKPAIYLRNRRIAVQSTQKQ
jgi:hypothetical protein